jgi:ketopantoate reductase
MFNHNNEAVCHICGQNPSTLCEGCNTLACEEHYYQALCDSCMAKVAALSESEQKAIDQECIAALERGERL